MNITKILKWNLSDLNDNGITVIVPGDISLVGDDKKYPKIE